MKVRGLVFFWFVFAAFSTGAAAADYVSDALAINMRVGPGNEFRINELLSAGTQIKIVSQADGWTLVRTPEGEQGYVLSRFLTDEPAARVQVESLRARVETLQSSNTEIDKKLAAALADGSKSEQRRGTLAAANQSLKTELADIKATAGNALKLRADNQEFREQLLALESEAERLRHENAALQSRRDGMKVGAFILVCGVIVGILLPLFRRPSRRNSWESL